MEPQDRLALAETGRTHDNQQSNLRLNQFQAESNASLKILEEVRLFFSNGQVPTIG